MARPRKVDTDSEDAPNPQFLHSYVTTRSRILRNDYQYVIRLAIQLITSTYRQMLRSLFNLLWPYHVQVVVTFECDASIKAGEHMRSGFDIHFKFFKFHAAV